MNEKKEKLLEKYNELLGLISEREEQAQEFNKFLSEKTNWLTAPASTRFHLAEEGGLVQHSVNVAETLLKLRDTLMPELLTESCVIVGLFHDTGKVGYEGIPYYIPNPEEWQVKKRGIKYKVNPECPHMDIATRSLYLVSQYIDLTPEEAQAVRYHDGQYIDENKSVAHRETPLTRLVQYADNWSGGVIEERE